MPKSQKCARRTRKSFLPKIKNVKNVHGVGDRMPTYFQSLRFFGVFWIDIPPKWLKYPVLAILGISKMALQVPESKF